MKHGQLTVEEYEARQKTASRMALNRAGKTWPEVVWTVADDEFDIRLRGTLATPAGDVVVEAWQEGDGWCAAIVVVLDLRDAEMAVRPASACWSPTIAFSLARLRDHLAAVHARAMIDVLDDLSLAQLVDAAQLARIRAPLAAVVDAGGLRGS